MAVPDSFLDRTVNVFVQSDDGPSDISLTISRSEIKQTESLHLYHERQQRILAKELSQYRLIQQTNVTIAGEPAIQADFSWVGEHGTINQRQLVFVAAPLPLVITMTFSSLTEIERWSPTVDQIAASTRLKKEEPNG
jgi:hypothetical protein